MSSNRLNARRRRAQRKAKAERLVTIADNLRNGDKEAVHAKSLRVVRSLSGHAIGMKDTRAYAPSAERLSPYGRCRVMHNAQGSKPVKSPFRRRFDNQ